MAQAPEAAVDRLYGLPREEFVAERDALAKQLRADGQRDEATAVKALPKPTVAAWAANQAVRSQKRAARELWKAGDALAKAQEALLAGKGSGPKLRAAAEAERAAVETVDGCLARVVDAVRAAGGVCLITADHGNAETMLEPDGVSPHTAHTTNPVPFVLTDFGATLRDGGELSDLAPTVLDLLGLARPAAMTGRSLIRR